MTRPWRNTGKPCWTAFREVEDALVQLWVFEREQQLQQEALDAARESLRLIENQYRAGTVDFNSVVSVQASALNNERSQPDPVGQSADRQRAVDRGAGRRLGQRAVGARIAERL